MQSLGEFWLVKGLQDFCDVFFDDLIIFSITWSDHARHLTEIFDRIRKAGLTLNPTKCCFANAEVDFLGRHLGLNCVQPLKAKIDVLLNFPRPKNKKQVLSWLGIAGYYGRFLPHYSELVLSLTTMLKKNKNFEWSKETEDSFGELKSRLATRPILRPPDYNEKFYLAIDASMFCVGGCLFQMYQEIEHPVCYFSRKLDINTLLTIQLSKRRCILLF